MVTAKRIDDYLRRYKSPLAGMGSVFVAEGRRYGINPALMVAIAGAESSFGKINSGQMNAWGWGPGRDFPSWQAAIGEIAKGLRSGYFDEGRTTIQAIGAKWAPQGASNDPTNLNSNWVQNVRKFYRELGAGGGLGGSVSPSVGTGGANIGSGTPGTGTDLTGLAMQNLSDIGSGSYDPLKSLASLTSLSGQVAPSAGGAAPTSTRLGAVPKGSITFNGQKLTHETAGLPGYRAVDIFANPGTAFVAPENGKVIRYQSTGGGTSGQVYGYGLYFQGDSGRTYFITHLGPRRARVGSRVRAGQRLGSVSRWDSGSPHAHVGIHG